MRSPEWKPQGGGLVEAKYWTFAVLPSSAAFFGAAGIHDHFLQLTAQRRAEHGVEREVERLARCVLAELVDIVLHADDVEIADGDRDAIGVVVPGQLAGARAVERQ